MYSTPNWSEEGVKLGINVGIVGKPLPISIKIVLWSNSGISIRCLQID